MEKRRRTLPGWFRSLNLHFKIRGNYEASVIADQVTETLSEKFEQLVGTAAELALDDKRGWEAAGARRIIEELGLGAHLEAAITRLRHQDGDHSDQDPWHEITEVTKTGAA